MILTSDMLREGKGAHGHCLTCLDNILCVWIALVGGVSLLHQLVEVVALILLCWIAFHRLGWTKLLVTDQHAVNELEKSDEVEMMVLPGAHKQHSSTVGYVHS